MIYMDTKKRGRKAISKTERSEVKGLRMLPSQWAKLGLLGGAKWVRARIDRAKIKGGE